MTKGVHNCPWEQAQGMNSRNVDGWDNWVQDSVQRCAGETYALPRRESRNDWGIRDIWKGCLNEHSQGP